MTRTIKMKLIGLMNPDYQGDNNQVKGILQSISEQSEQSFEFVSELSEAEWQYSDIEAFDWVIAAGDHGLREAQKIKQQNPNIKVLLSAHMVFDAFKDVQYWPDMVVLPESAAHDKEIANLISNHTKLCLTKGVPHTVNAHQIAEKAAAFQEILPELTEDTNVVGIILGGDAPTADQTIKLFTPKDAEVQANKIIEYLKGEPSFDESTVILVTNGPRTGKYNPETSVEWQENPHRSGVVDATSQRFIDSLSHQLQNKIHFYDFQFEALEKGPSAYLPMMNILAERKRGLWFVPAESTSMVTESSYLASVGVKVVAYFPSSTNEAHKAHVEDFSRMSVVTPIYRSFQSTASVSIKSSSAQVAEDWLNEIKKSTLQKYLDVCLMWMKAHASTCALTIGAAVFTGIMAALVPLGFGLATSAMAAASFSLVTSASTFFVLRSDEKRETAKQQEMDYWHSKAEKTSLLRTV